MNERRKLRWGQFTIGFLLLVMAACAVFSALFLQSQPAKVSGRVTVNGQPAAGEVIYVAASGKKIASRLNAGGEYTMRLQQGEYTVALKLPSAPAEYSNARTSGFAIYVAEGANRFDFDLAN